ncbi:hypothetical protein B0H19DRAFT_1262368 [Mycena capillaripes]|nr:hypothetical protein B0H19DRAFT_1262368 [Mycena capillaripes]
MSLTTTGTPSISASTRTIILPDGIAILWDENTVQFAASECTEVNCPSEPTIAHTLQSDKDEIVDVAVHDDNLFVLTGTQTGIHWRRELRRCRHWYDDPWTKDHAIYSYALRLFSVQHRLQRGPTLWLPDQAVNAAIRAGTDAVIIQFIGPDCHVAFWRTPGPQGRDWLCFHEEVTWDPDLIARKLGFQDFKEEIAHIEATDEDIAPHGWREDYKDVELLDYAFISDRFALRVRDSGCHLFDGSLEVEVLDLSVMTASYGRKPAPAVGSSLIRFTYVHSKTEAFITTPTTFSSDDVISVTSIADDGVFQAFYRVSQLSNLNPDTPAYLNAPAAIREEDHGFLEDAMLNNGPIFFGAVALMPGVDIDSNSGTPCIPAVRFVCFTDGNVMQNVDIPFVSFFAKDLFMMPVPPSAARKHAPDTLPYTVSWNGKDTLCILYRDNKYLAPERSKPPRCWLVKLGQDILLQLGLGVIS